MSVVRFQPAPVDPLQAMAEPLSQNGGTSGEVCLRKAESTTERGGGKKKPEKKITKGRPKLEKKEEAVLQVLEQRFPCRLCRKPWSRYFPAAHAETIPEQMISTLQPMDDPTLEQMDIP